MPAYIRFLHASPGAPEEVDVYVNGQRYINNLAYREFTEYLDIPPGSHQITIYRAGERRNPMARQTFNVEQQTIQTIAVIGRQNIGLFRIPEPRIGKSRDFAYVRFAQLSPNIPQVDLRLQDGKTIAQGIGYRGISNYTPIQPGRHVFNLYESGTNRRILYVPNINLKGDRFYTVYAVGLAGEAPPLQLLFPLDGNSYL